MKREAVIRWGLGAGVMLTGLAVDFVTKRIAEQNLPLGEIRPVLPFLSLQRTANTGVAFGLLQGRVGAILMATVVAVIVMFVYLRMERRPALAGLAGGLLMAGTLGNAIDRIRQGYVTDFLKFPSWPNFNAADIWLVAGTGLLILGLILSLRAAERTEREEERPQAQERPQEEKRPQVPPGPGARTPPGPDRARGKREAGDAGLDERSLRTTATPPTGLRGSDAGGDS